MNRTRTGIHFGWDIMGGECCEFRKCCIWNVDFCDIVRDHDEELGLYVGGKDGHTRKRGIFRDMYIKNGRSPLYIIRD